MKKKKKRYSEEFKKEAVRLLETRGKTSASEIAASLSVQPGQLYQWRKDLLGEAIAITSGRGESPEEELVRLRKEVALLRKEKDVLKKSIAVCLQEMRL